MLELHEAQQQVVSAITPLAAESVSLFEAADRYLALDIASQVDLPPFDNSSMDGYAVIASDISDASSASPVKLRIVGRVAAGESFSGTVAKGSCVRLFTGSPLPAGADAVVMQEDTRVDDQQHDLVHILDSAKPWENVRFRGEDVKCGKVVAKQGDRLTAARLSVIAAVGYGAVPVTRRPVIGLLATGSELVEAGGTLAPGQIYESNRVGLAALCRQAGAIPRIYPLVRDDLETTQAAFAAALKECDAIITSGGVSVGEFDFVKEAFEKVGGELAFWKVAIKPGKPFVFGRAGTKYLFGLPGNPVSGFVTFFLLVRPALLRMQGASQTKPAVHLAILAEPLVNRGDRAHYMRVAVDENGSAHSAGIQASHILGALANSTGLVCVPPNTALSPGEQVAVIRWD